MIAMALISRPVLALAIQSIVIPAYLLILVLATVFLLRTDLLNLTEQPFRSSSLTHMRTTTSKSAHASTARAPETVFGHLGFREGTYAEETGVYAAVGRVE
jgi:hypothetical protein